MAIPYTTTNAGTSIRNALGHSSIKAGSDGWQHVEDIQVKHSGAWRDTKEVYVKSGGTWRLVHEGEHFLFQVILAGQESEFNLATWISSQGYSGNKIKGAIILQGVQQQINMGNFSSDSKVYLRINAECRIAGKGGNGGTRGGQNGQDGQRGLYSRTPFITDNAGIIAGGGGGGGGGNNSNCVYQNTNYFGCMKGQQCSELVQNQSPAYGGGGGGGAGTPGGTGYDDGQNGQYTAGGSGGGDDGCESYSGGKGGNLGQNGDGAEDGNGGTGGTAGTAIDGISYRYSQSGSGDGDIRNTTIN
tara:strand:- start:1171 stop:2073 length:903 start_codon:yes stop_codon:yes gene_type:complete